MTGPTHDASTVDRLASIIQAAISHPDQSPEPESRPAAVSPLASSSLAALLTMGHQPEEPRVPMPEDPGLPTGLLPPHIEEWTAIMASLTSVPTAMVTIPFLAATGGVIGNRLALQLHAGWTEYPTL